MFKTLSLLHNFNGKHLPRTSNMLRSSSAQSVTSMSCSPQFFHCCANSSRIDQTSAVIALCRYATAHRKLADENDDLRNENKLLTEKSRRVVQQMEKRDKHVLRFYSYAYVCALVYGFTTTNMQCVRLEGMSSGLKVNFRSNPEHLNLHSINWNWE